MPTPSPKRKTKRPSTGKKQHRPQKAAKLALRRSKVSELLLQGRSYREIARAIGIRSTHTIYEDVKLLISEWKEQQAHHITEWIALELERIGHIESEAWEAWEKSLQDHETWSEEDGDTYSKTKRVREGQSGNPAFLEIALKCVARRCDMLGLDQPKKVSVQESWEDDVVGLFNEGRTTEEEIRKEFGDIVASRIMARVHAQQQGG